MYILTDMIRLQSYGGIPHHNVTTDKYVLSYELSSLENVWYALKIIHCAHKISYIHFNVYSQLYDKIAKLRGNSTYQGNHKHLCT